ncbi:uncharacterized protein TNCV_4846951 [Trichonephila clavipes]|nr:uncharacterized protein TNCV_4846951 [Trichonephila clavipes]
MCGTVNCTTHSYDLSCLDFFLCGHTKSVVYASPVDSVEVLVARIAVVAFVIREMPEIFTNVPHSLRRQCDACIFAGGCSFEQFCASDEVEKLAYQLNEEAERTEIPIRRLSKVMYGSTCADMQVVVMGECLSSIKNVVGTTSGCFYPRSNLWEVGGRPQWDKCGCRVRNCSQHRFTTFETIANYRNISGGSLVVVHEEPQPQMTGILSYRPEENRQQTAG